MITRLADNIRFCYWCMYAFFTCVTITFCMIVVKSLLGIDISPVYPTVLAVIAIAGICITAYGNHRSEQKLFREVLDERNDT